VDQLRENLDANRSAASAGGDKGAATEHSEAAVAGPLPLPPPRLVPQPDLTLEKGAGLPPPAPESAGARQFGSHKVLGVLGRGGMGVVYLARDERLKRLAAVKIALAGPHIGPEGLARFRREAEVVARLHHPNIVQIYEVGEWEGEGQGVALPYFAMEYV